MSYVLLGHDSDHNKIEVFEEDRLYHTYLIGSTGYGKTQVMTHLVLEDAKFLTPKQGLLVLDPLGGLCDTILHFLPPDRLDDVILLQLDSNFPAWGMNLYECPNISDIGEVHKTVERVLRVWNKIFSISRDTPLLSTLMRNLSYLIIFNPPLTMVEIPRLLHDKNLRQQLVTNITYEPARFFWERFDNLRGHEYLEQVDVVMRRFDEFVAPVVEQIVGQYTSTIDFRKLMDEGKIILVKMNPEFPGASELIGSIMISLLLMAAYSRRNQQKRKQFNLYVDEFQNYATREFQTIYSEARQFGIGCLVSHQHRSQIPEDMADLSEALMQASTFICLQTTPQTARELSSKFDNTPPEPEMEEVSRRSILIPKESKVLSHLLLKGHKNKRIVELVDVFRNRSFSLPHFPEDLHNPLDKFLALGMKGETLQSETMLNLAIEIIKKESFIFQIWIQPNINFYDFPDVFFHYYPSEEQIFEAIKAFIKDGSGLEDILYHQNIKVFFAWSNPLGASLAGYPMPMTEKEKEWQKECEAYWATHYKQEAFLYNDQPPPKDTLFPASRREDSQVIRERKANARKMARESVRKIQEYLAVLVELITLLHTEPLQDESGEFETIYRPGQKDTPDRIRDTITNQLIHLEQGHARVRLKREPPNLHSKVCHRCGTVNIVQTAMCQECKIFLRTEYVVELARPQGNYAPLEPRIRRIIKNNVKQGYLRKREDIEAEIKGRMPIKQAAKQQPGKPDDEPPSNPKKKVF